MENSIDNLMEETKPGVTEKHAFDYRGKLMRKDFLTQFSRLQESTAGSEQLVSQSRSAVEVLSFRL